MKKTKCFPKSSNEKRVLKQEVPNIEVFPFSCFGDHFVTKICLQFWISNKFPVCIILKYYLFKWQRFPLRRAIFEFLDTKFFSVQALDLHPKMHETWYFEQCKIHKCLVYSYIFSAIQPTVTFYLCKYLVSPRDLMIYFLSYSKQLSCSVILLYCSSCLYY